MARPCKINIIFKNKYWCLQGIISIYIYHFLEEAILCNDYKHTFDVIAKQLDKLLAIFVLHTIPN